MSVVGHTGVAAFLSGDNIDTDVIMPMAPLMRLPKSALGAHIFEPYRYLANGSANPDFILNKFGFRCASVLVCGENFGCGSSREAAVYGLYAFGIRVIIAKSFGDIFYRNCIKNGVLPISLAVSDYSILEQLLAASVNPRSLTIDLLNQSVRANEEIQMRFNIDPGHKARLLEGQSEVALTLSYADEIAAYQKLDRDRRPWIWHLKDDDRC